MDNPIMDTLTQNWAMSEIFKKIRSIFLSVITIPDITYYWENTSSVMELAGCLLEVKLLESNEYDKLRSILSPYEKNQYLYNDVLNKKVERQGDYEKLIRALRKSGNNNIADKIFEKLKTFKSPDVDEDITTEFAHILPGAINSDHTPSDRTIVIPDKAYASKGSKNVIYAALLTVGGLVGLIILVVTTTHNGNQFNPSSGMNLTTLKSLTFSPGNLSAEDDSRSTDLELAETVTQTQFLEVLTVENSVEPLQHSQHHQQSDLKNIYTTDPLQVKISEDQILPKPSTTKLSEKQLPITHPPPAIEIGSPLDMRHLPEMKSIHLTITNSNDADWRNWTRDNALQAENVSSLILRGTVSAVEIQHFLSSFKNLTSLQIENLTGKLCGKLFYVKSQPLSHDKLEYLGMTHVKDNPCRSAYQFFTDAVDFPNLKRVEIKNLPIVLENEKPFREFFKKVETQLNQLDLRNVLVRMGSQAFADSEFKNLASLHSEFREPNSEGAKSVFANLNRATPNLVDISTNLVCTPDEKSAFDENWFKINGAKRMICDVRSSK